MVTHLFTSSTPASANPPLARASCRRPKARAFPPTNDELADHTRRRTELVSSSFGHGAGSRSRRSSECVLREEIDNDDGIPDHTAPARLDTSAARRVSFLLSSKLHRHGRTIIGVSSSFPSLPQSAHVLAGEETMASRSMGWLMPLSAFDSVVVSVYKRLALYPH
jgi:hypothetical protein